jgi:hypothetical protein
MLAGSEDSDGEGKVIVRGESDSSQKVIIYYTD